MDKNTKQLILSMLPKWIAVSIIIILVVFNFLPGQMRGVINLRPELIPYQIIPIDDIPNYRLEVGIELMFPYDSDLMLGQQYEETLDIIYKRIEYEVINPHKNAGVFQIDGKTYHLIRIPYTGVSKDYNSGWQ
jgi:hypothetical protein|tara:strand:+ start:415 stop:813 length:399 start_codon:yes stop_codon:yes gene_type:complete